MLGLTRLLGSHGAWVTEPTDDGRLRAVAFRLGGAWVKDYVYDPAGTRCEPVLTAHASVHIADGLIERFPDDADLRRFGAVSYHGRAIRSAEDEFLGHLAVLDVRPMAGDGTVEGLVSLAAGLARAELLQRACTRRLARADRRLDALIDGGFDALLELDEDGRISRINPAGEKQFDCWADQAVGSRVADLLTDAGWAKLRRLLASSDRPELPDGPARPVWVPGLLEARTMRGREFRAQATLLHHRSADRPGWLPDPAGGGRGPVLDGRGPPGSCADPGRTPGAGAGEPGARTPAQRMACLRPGRRGEAPRE